MTVRDENLLDALRVVIDPEVGMNIVDLGLVYRLELDEKGVSIDLTMTSPACPLGEVIMAEARRALEGVTPSGTPIDIQLVWDPPWTPQRMSEEARAHWGWDA
jgi:metal-sulfur cluster biosynthetic enzyme